MCFLIRSLDRGGAERQLTLLAKGLHAKGLPVKVVTFYPCGACHQELEAAGVPVVDLGKRRRWDVLPFLWRLVRTLRCDRPAALYCFLPVANILGVVVRPFVSGMRLIWGVRASNVDLERYDRLSRWVGSIEASLSGFADGIVCNSKAGLEYHVRQGFPPTKMVVIENGIDVEHLRFDAGGRARVREEWGIGEEEILVGLVARLDPMKDHPTFLAAAAVVAKYYPLVRFVCVGDDPAGYRAKLGALAQSLDLGDRVIWAGPRDGMPAVYSAFDIALSTSSYVRGFPTRCWRPWPWAVR